MPAVATIALADAQATPVTHNFLPLGPDLNGVWWFEDQSASATIGNGRISVQLVRPSGAASGQNSGQRMNRVKIGIHTPKLETLGTNDAGLTPPATVAYVARANTEFMFPERALLQDRKDLRKYASNILTDANIISLVESLLNYY